MERHDFYCSVIPLNCTVQVLYFFIAVSSLEDYAKTSESITFIRTRERERKYTVNVQCSLQYTLLLLYSMLVMFYCT